MRFKTLSGKYKTIDLRKYIIDWDGKSLSKFQFGVKQFLKPYWQGQICCEELPVAGTRMRIDIYNANKKIAVEVSGAQHENFSKFHHNNSRFNYLKQIQRDQRKYEWCQLNEIQLIEIFPRDLPLTEEFFTNLGVRLV